MGRVGEVQNSVLLQNPGCHCRVHQRVVKVELLHGEAQAPVQAAHHHTTVAAIEVLVPNVDDDAAVRHLHRLQTCRERKKKERKSFYIFLLIILYY